MATRSDLAGFCHFDLYFGDALCDVKEALALAEHNMEWQLRTERQSLLRSAEIGRIDDPDHLMPYLLQEVERRFTVSLPMQFRFAALGAFTNTIDWAARSFKHYWKPPLPKDLSKHNFSAASFFKHLDEENVPW